MILYFSLATVLDPRYGSNAFYLEKNYTNATGQVMNNLKAKVKRLNEDIANAAVLNGTDQNSHQSEDKQNNTIPSLYCIIAVMSSIISSIPH